MSSSIATNQTILVVGGGISGMTAALKVVYYSQLMSVAYGGSAKQAGLDGHVIQPKRLQEVAEK